MMKKNRPTAEDEKLARLLKRSSQQAQDNEWFSARVMNRLPPKQHKPCRWVGNVLYLVAILVCAGCWCWVIMCSDFEVITVRDIVNFIILIVISLALLFSTVWHIMNADSPGAL